MGTGYTAWSASLRGVLPPLVRRGVAAFFPSTVSESLPFSYRSLPPSAFTGSSSRPEGQPAALTASNPSFSRRAASLGMSSRAISSRRSSHSPGWQTRWILALRALVVVELEIEAAAPVGVHVDRHDEALLARGVGDAAAARLDEIARERLRR